MTLLNLLTWFASVFADHGAKHAAVMSIGPHWGWIESHHWIIRICYRGAAGCHI